MTRRFRLTRRDAEQAGDLRDIARLHQIDRELVGLRVRLSGLKWVVLPGLGLVTAMIGRRLLEIGPPSMSALLTALIGAVTGGVAIIHGYRRSRETVDDLLEERALLFERLNSDEADREGDPNPAPSN